MDPDRIDLLERARAGDTRAFADLVGLWGDQTVRLAWLLAGDRRAAEQAVRAAWLGVWRELPSLHTRRAFRPWLMATVVEAARERATGTLIPAMAPLQEADEETRIAAALRFGLGLRFGEIALAQGADLRATRKRIEDSRDALGSDDDKILTETFADALRGIELSDTFTEDALLPRLERAPAASSAREVGTDPSTLWAALCTPEGLSAATGTTLQGRIKPGGVDSHLAGRGRLAGRWRAREDVIVTFADAPRRLSWTSAITPLGATTPVELRWTAVFAPVRDGARATLSLDGVATVPGAFHRLLPRRLAELPERMAPHVHAGLERLASVAASRARSAPL